MQLAFIADNLPFSRICLHDPCVGTCDLCREGQGGFAGSMVIRGLSPSSRMALAGLPAGVVPVAWRDGLLRMAGALLQAAVAPHAEQQNVGLARTSRNRSGARMQEHPEVGPIIITGVRSPAATSSFGLACKSALRFVDTDAENVLSDHDSLIPEPTVLKILAAWPRVCEGDSRRWCWRRGSPGIPADAAERLRLRPRG